MEMMKNTIWLLMIAVMVSFTACESKEEDTSGNDDDIENRDRMGKKDHNEMDMNGNTNGDIPSPQIFSDVSTDVQDQINAILADYLSMKDAMVNSDAASVQNDARELFSSAKEVKTGNLNNDQKKLMEQHLSRIRSEAKSATENTDIEQQRQSLEPISEAVFTLIKAFGANDQELYYQYCPMAFDNEGAHWVSADAEIRNPYFGERMMKCGSTKSTLPAN